MRRTVVIILSVVILCSLFVGVFAVTNSNTEDMTTPSIVNLFEYAKAPEGLDVFIYHGYTPYSSPNLDTSECVLDRLYVYNSLEDSLVTISEQAVEAYTYTQTALYYVTEEQKIYKTDYSGTNHECLYQCVQGNIENLNSYFDTLYFIENRTSIKLLDVASKTTQEIWAHENLSWAIMLNADQLIATTVEEDNYLYDIPTNTVTLISEIESTNLITAAVKGTASNNARTTTPNFSTMVTQENDVSFPLPSYPAVPDSYFNQPLPQYSEPSSWFHENGAEGCSKSNCKDYAEAGECMGFARYVHDVYLHIDDEDITDWAWKNTPCITEYEAPVGAMEDNPVAGTDPTKLKLFNGDAQLIKEFFRELNTGAYVRYGKYKDSSRSDGVHSIVFIARDAQGIWAYECNQDYVVNDPDNYYGCGVFIQYYTYVDLGKYEFIINYVNHNFTEVPDYDKDDGTIYHKVGCNKCGGYVRQKHTSISASYINANSHRATFNCCGGRVETVPHTNVSTKLTSRTQHQTTYKCCNHSLSAVAHTGSVEYVERSSALHGVEYSCCSGYVTAPHILDTVNGQLQCTLCGYTNNSILSIEGEEIN